MRSTKRLGRLTGLLAVLALCGCAMHQGGTMTGGDVGLQSPQGTATAAKTTAATVPSTGSSGTAASGTTTGPTTETNGSSAKKVDCSTVRCEACPEGQHPALVTPDCCRCMAG